MINSNDQIKERRFLWSYVVFVLTVVIVGPGILTFCNAQWWQALVVSIACVAIGVLVMRSSIKTTYPPSKRYNERILLWQAAINMSLTLVICYVGFYLFNAGVKNILYYMPAAAILTAIIMGTVKKKISKNRLERDKLIKD